METRDLGRESKEFRPNPSIRLEFFRHDEKAKPTEGQPDTTVRLTPKGRVAATEAGKNLNPEPEVAVAFGSNRERSVETAMRGMLANQEEIGPDTTLEDIRELVAGQVKVGRKDMVSPNLNFDWSGSKEFNEPAMARYAAKDGLRFLVEDSDQLVEKLKDQTSTSWSRQAGNIAELIKKYYEILPTWQRVAAEHPEKYAQFNNEMQRFMGSHQTVTESFLMKVIEKTEGREAVMKFIESLPDKNGFGFSEGFTINLIIDDAGRDIVMNYKDRQWTLTPELINEIINDKKELDKSVRENK
ncbi:MAG: histidine phosphatase family protein [bacterium]|nr:histidine phosphatase family protein [bacterium]